jgi:hypothetical protein
MESEWTSYMGGVGRKIHTKFQLVNLKGREPLGRPVPRWEDNIKLDLKEIRFVALNWIHVVQDRDRWQTLVNAVMNLRVS